MRYFLYCRKSSEADDRQVMSIQSQRSELERVFAGRDDIEIVETFEEAKSAKTPGRPIFADMIARIELGEAAGVIAWAPDRLARNSIDGGRVVYLLDTGKLVDLKFSTYTFENNSQGKFMLQIMFGQSKYYSDALSENVKRGNRTKIEGGWRPNQAPLGYINDPATRTIIPDPLRFPLIRQMFELALTGSFSCRQIAIIARDEWGFRTPKRRRTGGKLLSMASMHRILTNPFYTGVNRWGGITYPGKHEPALTTAEFDRVQQLIRRPDRVRAKSYSFAYTGLIRCGGCGRGVTAEHKINAYGSRYLYYHCTRRMLGPRCRQPALEVRKLEEQIASFLDGLMCEPGIELWLLQELAIGQEREAEANAARRRSIEVALQMLTSELEELRGMRMRNLITDSEFAQDRSRIESEQAKLTEKLAQPGQTEKSIELFPEAISFSRQAVDWFPAGDDAQKRLILETTVSNLTLSDKKLRFEAAKPFSRIGEIGQCLALRAVNDNVPTNHTRQPTSRPLTARVKARARRVARAAITELEADPPAVRRLAANLARARDLLGPVGQVAPMSAKAGRSRNRASEAHSPGGERPTQTPPRRRRSSKAV